MWRAHKKLYQLKGDVYKMMKTPYSNFCNQMKQQRQAAGSVSATK